MTTTAGTTPQGNEENVVQDEVQNELPMNDEQVQKTEESQDDSSKEVKTPSTTFGRRMAKHTAELEAAILEREYWKKEAMKASVTGAQQETATKTSRLDFESDDEWLEARLEAEKKKWLDEFAVTSKQQQRIEEVSKTFIEQVEAEKKQQKDWDEVFAAVQEAEIQLHPEATEFIVESPIGAKLAYNLSKDLDKLEKFVELSPKKQLIELAKMEERLSAKKEAPPVTKKVTEAPPKLAETKSAGISVNPAPDRFKSKEAWREWRALPKNQR